VLAAVLDREHADWVVGIVLGLAAGATFVLFRSCNQLGGRLTSGLLALVAVANPIVGVGLIFLIASW
jgi:hypothetical protein